MVISYLIQIMLYTALGFLSGLGIGGGSLLILWLTLVMELAHPEARIINLLFYLPCAVICCLFRHKQGTLHPGKLLPAILAGCGAAALFTLLCQGIDLSVLKKLFGGLLLFTGLREVLYRPRKDK